ncbi:MAG: spermidine synthase [Zetaproteobacteria bacterium]|nr:spermidine synthase [Pseudobdellovibrionaceae bacterium]
MTSWFVEKDADELSYGYSLKETLFSGKSHFQEIKVFETKAYGKMLTIDDFVMLTESDEFVYHEMIAHVPMLHHKSPRRVLVIGGGDGGTVREILKHQEVEHIVLCEIDSLVIDVSKKYFPKVSQKLDDPKLTIHIGDGFQFMREQKNAFDIILIDSTDPIGPGEGLFTKEFYASVSKALCPGGLLTIQSESPWAQAKFLEKIYQNIKGSFQTVKPYIGSVPTYPRGLWSWTLATNDSTWKSSFDLSRFNTFQGELEYLTEGMMRNIFDLPNFYKKKLGLS